MFFQICEVCQSEPQFKTIEADFNGEKKKLNVCMDCAYEIEDREEREKKHFGINWKMVAKDFVGSRNLFFFQNIFSDDIQVRIVAPDENKAWSILCETVKACRREDIS